MNKVKLKKKIGSDQLNALLSSSEFIGFFCVQNLNTIEKIELKKTLSSQGFDFKILKSAIVFKYLANALPSLKGLFSGTLAICYPKKENTFDFINLKEVFLTIKKTKNTFFLGGLFEGIFINQLFESKVCSLKDKTSISLEQLSLIQNNLISLLSTISGNKNTLSYILANKAK